MNIRKDVSPTVTHFFSLRGQTCFTKNMKILMALLYSEYCYAAVCFFLLRLLVICVIFSSVVVIIRYSIYLSIFFTTTQNKVYIYIMFLAEFARFTYIRNKDVQQRLTKINI